jgi:hypothetical protein
MAGYHRGGVLDARASFDCCVDAIVFRLFIDETRGLSLEDAALEDQWNEIRHSTGGAAHPHAQKLVDHARKLVEHRQR